MNKLSPKIKFGNCSSCNKLLEFENMFNHSNIKIENKNSCKVTNIIGKKLALKHTSKVTSLF